MGCDVHLQYGDSEARSLWSSLKLKIPEFFKDVPDIKPSLLHGDLWSGNAAETDNGPGNATTNRFKLLNRCTNYKIAPHCLTTTTTLLSLN